LESYGWLREEKVFGCLAKAQTLGDGTKNLQAKVL
jgi:hypothetical protein